MGGRALTGGRQGASQMPLRNRRVLLQQRGECRIVLNEGLGSTQSSYPFYLPCNSTIPQSANVRVCASCLRSQCVRQWVNTELLILPTQAPGTSLLPPFPTPPSSHMLQFKEITSGSQPTFNTFPITTVLKFCLQTF